MVAEHRAGYYVKDQQSSEYKEEIDFVMNDSYQGIIWLLHFTDYEYWKDHTTKLNNQVHVTDDDFWCYIDDFKIVEVE